MSTREDPEYNRVTGRYEFEDEDGVAFEQDPETKNWLPVIDEERLKEQQAAYSVPGVDEEAPAIDHGKKRKIQETFTSADAGQPPVESNKKPHQEQKPRETSVYVQNLPPDTTVEELEALFGKCGLLLEDPATGQKRIKIYTNSDGKQKGDALIIYFREQSVSLAIQMLDDTSLRGDNNLIRVSKATFEHKKGKTADTGKDTRDKATKQKATSRAGKLKSKLADWSDDELEEQRKPSKLDKTVILKGMFTLDELERDPTLLLDLKEDVREECQKLGEITNIVLYDKEPDGIISIKFKEEDHALECVQMMNGRYFGGRQIVAERSDGKKRYLKSGKSDELEGDGNPEEVERLEKFGQWLEGDD